jgi:NAD(P)-dependent dehydrogenase (short-subunit alcohol dehydrogenase family)
MSQRLEGKVALITGGCSGIGLGAVELFVSEGACVVAADIQSDKGTILESRFPGKVIFCHCDVMREAAIEAAMGVTQRSFGGLDILFNNAGAAGVDSTVEKTDGAAWDHTFALLLRSVILGMKHAIPLMKSRGAGSIINTASVAGLQAGWGPIAYSTAKAGVIHLTKITAAELSPQNIRVNAICPGLIATSIFGGALGLTQATADQLAARVEDAGAQFQPIQKSGLPQDVAQAALYLASDTSIFVTGTHLVVDGGLTVGPRHSWDPTAAPPLMEALGFTDDESV